MAEYQVIIHWGDGEDYIEEETYDSEQEAEERAWYLLSCAKTGNEILHMSNPGDNPLGDDEASYEIVEL